MTPPVDTGDEQSPEFCNDYAHFEAGAFAGFLHGLDTITNLPAKGERP